MDGKIQPLADAIYADKVRRARQLTVVERIETCLELSEGAIGLMKDGIRAQFDLNDEQQVDDILRQRMRRLRQLSDHGLYRPLATA